MESINFRRSIHRDHQDVGERKESYRDRRKNEHGQSECVQKQETAYKEDFHNHLWRCGFMSRFFLSQIGEENRTEIIRISYKNYQKEGEKVAI